MQRRLTKEELVKKYGLGLNPKFTKTIKCEEPKEYKVRGKEVKGPNKFFVGMTWGFKYR